MRLSHAVLPLLVLVACSSSSSSPDDGSSGTTPPGTTPPGTTPPGSTPPGTTPPGTTPPGTPPPPPPATQNESEPNNGSTATELNAMTIPGTMAGKIDPANDIDVFGITVSPGEFWTWTLTPTTADLAPDLAVFDTANTTPPRAFGGSAGAPLGVDHFVLGTGTFVAAVRDARNVPNASGKGGPTYGYTLKAEKSTRTPVAVTSWPATKTGTLASLGTIDLFTFTGTNGKGFDIVVKAARKVPPSTLDSRLSLYDVTTGKSLITNDDAPGTTDSQIGSATPFTDTFVVVLENEGTNGADLSYEVDFTLRP